MATNLAEIIPAIFTGPKGEQLSPEQIRDRQLIAQSLMAQATDTSPNAGGWASVLAKGVQGFQAGRERRSADDAIAGNNTYNSDLVNSLLSGSSPSTPSSPLAASASTSGVAQEMAQTSPAPTVDISGDKETFVASLLPAAIEESKRTGVDPRIIVAQAAQETGWGRSAPGNNYFGIKSHGQGGGQNLATHEYVNGKRVNVNDSFRTFESPADSVRGYGDFILQNPRYEGLRTAQGLDGQLQALQASGYATDPNYSRSVGAIARGIRLPETPAAAIEAAAPASGFRGSDYNSPMLTYDDRGAQIERPYRDPAVSVQPQAPPQSGFDAGRFGDPAAPPASAPPMAGVAPEIYSAQTDFAPELPAPVNVAPAPAVAAVQQPAAPPVSQPVQAPASNPSAVAQALRVMADPRANEGTRRVAQALLQQEQQKQQFAQEQFVWQQRQDYERQQQSNDPLRQLQIQKAQIEINSANQPQRQPLMNAGNGALYDPNEKSWIQAPNTGQDKLPDSVRALQERANLAGLKPGTPEYNQFMISGGSGGTQLSVGPNGEVSFSQGGAAKPLTESQSKDTFFTTRMTAAAPTIDQFETALMSAGEAVAGAIPGGRYLQSEEYQLAKDAGDDFVAAFLRKDSGAALTKEEKSEYGSLLLPQPTDKPALIAAKRQRRQIAVQAIKSGLPSNAVEGVIKAINAVPGADQPAQTTAEKPPAPGKRLKFNPATGELE